MPKASTQAIDFDPGCFNQTHLNRPCADLRNVDTERRRTLRVLRVHVKFVHLTVRMPSSDKLGKNFHAVGTNGCLRFQTLLAISRRLSQLAMQNVARI